MFSLNLRGLLPLLLALAAGAADFDRDVRPILADKCYACHGPDQGQRKTPLRLDTEEGAAVDLLSGGKAIVPGNPDGSGLIRRITSDDQARRMPPAYAGHDKLSDAEIETLRSWISEGAKWSRHWAFVTPRKQDPAPGDGTAIDRFIRDRLTREGLKPAEAAPRATLIRRVSLDLTGLPPTPAQVDAFVNDDSNDAYEKVVDRLLGSKAYGERMAVRWLDAARYADTNGYQSDGVRSMWRWRDWVIDAFNRNMPFDQFTIEQIAGDLLRNPTRDQVIATGFNRNHRTTSEGGSVEEEYLVEYAADRTETTSTVWLGLTVGCARCHDHKFDPISQKDFYRFFAYFNNLPERGLVFNFGNDHPMIQAPTPRQELTLAKLDRELESAKRLWEKLQRTVEREESAWAKGLAGTDSGFVDEGLVARYSLDGDLEVDARVGVDDEKRETKSRPASLEFDHGRFGKAAVFDGERYVHGGGVAGFDYLDPFTVSFWMKPNKVEGGVISRMQDHANASGWGVILRGGRIRFELTMRHTDLSMRVVSKRAIEDNAWKHIAVTYTGERPSHRGLTIYVNGESWDFEIEWDDLKWPIQYAGYPFRIGAAAGERFDGMIGEVRIYERAMSSDEVATLSLRDTLGEIAAKPAKKRSPAEKLKLRLAFFENGAPEQIRDARQALALAQGKRDAFNASIPTVMVMRDAEAKPAHILNRGAYDAPGEAVDPGTPASLPAPRADWPRNRLGLARWLVDRSNPLTARVAVNRMWQMLFGVGLVKTAEDFGTQGERPSHPELLDWLAVEFMESGWDVKGILKTMVMSQTYRQSSSLTREKLDKDPENRLLARGPRFRLPAEAVRDQALFASGLLNDKLGGPSVKPYQPDGLWRELSGSSYKRDRGDKLYRRSLYTYWKRTVAPPGMIGFDAPDRESCTVRRARTNTPLQALGLMNDVTYLETARKMAGRMMREGGASPDERIAYGFRLALARPPTDSERAPLRRAFDQFEDHFAIDPDEAVMYLREGDSPADPDLEPVELAAYASVASLIFNLDEAVTKE